MGVLSAGTTWQPFAFLAVTKVPRLCLRGCSPASATHPPTLPLQEAEGGATFSPENSKLF